jgi:septal ring factor EnvC (AmiA/AmiB activator)
MKKLIFYLLLTFLSINLLANSIDDKKNQINKIENEIKRKGEEIKKNNQKIQTINRQTETLKEKITRVEKELSTIEKEKEDLKKKIQIVSRKIDYGQRNLRFSSKELTIITNDYTSMLQAWQKKELTEEEDVHNFKEILSANEKRQDEIINVQTNIKKVKADIEKEKVKLKTLENQLATKERQQENKKRQHNQLIAQYNREKKNTVAKTNAAKSSISSLQKQKAAIEKEIENIIKTRTKQLGNVDYSTIAKNLGTFKKPVSGKVVIGFNQLKAGGVRSSGQEIDGALGERVLAANKGKVIYSGKFMNMGNVVMIDHGYNLITIYGNLISTYVKVGTKVNKGRIIGLLGLNSDGYSYLYYETRFNLKSANPNIF